MKMQDSNVIPFPKEKIRKNQEPFKGPVLIDQLLRRDPKPVFRANHYCDISVRLPAVYYEKRIQRLVFTVETPVCGFKPSSPLIIQFISGRIELGDDSMVVHGKLIADREIPVLLAIKEVQRILERHANTVCK